MVPPKCKGATEILTLARQLLLSNSFALWEDSVTLWWKSSLWHRWPIWPLNVYEHCVCSTQNVLPTHPIADIMKWHPVTASSSKIRISRWCVALFIWPAWGYSWYCDLQSKMTSHLSHPASNTQWWRRDRINITTNLNSKREEWKHTAGTGSCNDEFLEEKYCVFLAVEYFSIWF